MKNLYRGRLLKSALSVLVSRTYAVKYIDTSDDNAKTITDQAQDLNGHLVWRFTPNAQTRYSIVVTSAANVSIYIPAEPPKLPKHLNNPFWLSWSRPVYVKLTAPVSGTIHYAIIPKN